MTDLAGEGHEWRWAVVVFAVPCGFVGARDVVAVPFGGAVLEVAEVPQVVDRLT